MRNFSIYVHNTMVWHIDAIIHAISYHTCIFICKKPAKTKATQARNIPAHILLSGVGLLKRGYNTPSNSGMRGMMKRALKACIWSGLNVPKNPEWIEGEWLNHLLSYGSKANGRGVTPCSAGRRVEVGKGGTLILPKRVCAVEQSMVCGVPRVKQDVQFYKMSSFCLVGALPHKLCWKEVNHCKVNLCLRRWWLMNAMHALTYVQWKSVTPLTSWAACISKALNNRTYDRYSIKWKQAWLSSDCNTFIHFSKTHLRKPLFLFYSFLRRIA